MSCLTLFGLSNTKFPPTIISTVATARSSVGSPISANQFSGMHPQCEQTAIRFCALGIIQLRTRTAFGVVMTPSKLMLPHR